MAIGSQFGLGFIELGLKLVNLLLDDDGADEIFLHLRPLPAILILSSLADEFLHTVIAA